MLGEIRMMPPEHAARAESSGERRESQRSRAIAIRSLGSGNMQREP